MEIAVKSGSPEKQRSACLVLGVFEPRRLSAPAAEVDATAGGFLSNVLRRGDMNGGLGHTLMLYDVPNVIADRVLLVGCGKERDFREQQYRKALTAVIKALEHTGIVDATFYLPELHVRGRALEWKVQYAAQTLLEGLYRFDKYKSGNGEDKTALRRVTLAVPHRSDLRPAEEGVGRAEAIARATAFARDLANEPGNVCTPSWLAEQGQAMGERLGLKVTVLGPEEMESLGMNFLLGVAKGSAQPPRLITIEYHGGPEKQKPVVLVGKGLTFDAGGISLKPADKMDEMKYDMCGGAAVLAAIQMAAELKLPLNVVAIVPASENLPDGKANKPGDVQRGMSGKTVEILNTDAEGRLILADALTYAGRFDPDVVIDVATLTGACVIALGAHAAGLLGNNERLIRDLLAAGEESMDRAWQLPLWEEYQEQLKSPIADMANIGGRPAGTITGACFLSRFTGDYKWAHLDIAGVAWTSGEKKGATGRPVPLLGTYLIHRATETAKS